MNSGDNGSRPFQCNSTEAGELFRLTQEQAAQVLAAPLRKQAGTTTVLAALASHPSAPTIHEPAPEAKAALDDITQQITTDMKDQGEFGY